MTKAERSAAAKKAARTRAKGKPSKAGRPKGKKGKRTKAQLSAAAKKAWATRRAGGKAPKAKPKKGRCLKWSKKLDPKTGKKRCLKREKK